MANERTEPLQLNLGSLRSAMSLTLHTHHASRIWHGRAPAEGRPGIIGLNGFISIMNKLKRGAEVEVYRHDPGGWCAIRPVEGSFSWVSARYVKPARCAEEMPEVDVVRQVVLTAHMAGVPQAMLVAPVGDLIPVGFLEAAGHEVIVLAAGRQALALGVALVHRLAHRLGAEEQRQVSAGIAPYGRLELPELLGRRPP